MDKQNDTSTVTDTAQGDQSSNPPANVATSTSQGEQRPPISVEALQQKIAELERDNKKYRDERKQQDAAIQAAEQARLAEQGQFKQLAEQHEAKVKELEPIAARYEALAEQVHTQIEAQIKDWPAELKTLVPSRETPVDERMARVEQLKPLLEKLQQRSAPGNSPNPRPATQTPEDLSKAYEKRLRASGSYFKI